jgi:hypothetical protein
MVHRLDLDKPICFRLQAFAVSGKRVFEVVSGEHRALGLGLGVSAMAPAGGALVVGISARGWRQWQGCCRVPPTAITATGPVLDRKQRTAAAATTCAKVSRQPVERAICSTWLHTKFPDPDRSRLAHTAVSHGWFLAKDLRS